MSHRTLLVVTLLHIIGCFASHGRSNRDATDHDDVGPIEVLDADILGDVQLGLDTRPQVDAPDPTQLPCTCDLPGAQVCRLPFMCCPVTQTCENPASFRCSGQLPPKCP